MNLSRWSVELDGAQHTVELEHRTWWERAILRVDGKVVIRQSINLAMGYDRGVDLTAQVDDHRLTVRIRAVGLLGSSYKYELRVDDALASGGEPLGTLAGTRRPTILGLAEGIVWASFLSAAINALVTGRVIQVVVMLAGLVVGSIVLRLRTLPRSWGVAAAALILVTTLFAISVAGRALPGSNGV